MTKSITVPPYVASPDNIRCAQSVVLMVLKHFKPEKNWTMADVDELCSYVEGKWTWSEAPAVSLAEMGFDVICYTDFEFDKFIAAPEHYFIEKQGLEHGAVTYKNIDLPSSVDVCKRYIAHPHIQTFTEGWTTYDMVSLLEKGYLLMCWVNRKLMYSLPDSDSGHFILVFHADQEQGVVVFHDPGSCSRAFNGLHINAWQNGCVGIEHLLQSGRDGGENGTCLLAFKV